MSIKWFALLGILLFLGIAITPSVSANFKTTSEKHKIDFIGMDLKPIKINQEQSNRINELVDEYHKSSPDERDFFGLLDDINDVGIFTDRQYKIVRTIFKHHFLQNEIYNKLSDPEVISNDEHINERCMIVATLFNWDWYDYGFITLIPPLGYIVYLKNRYTRFLEPYRGFFRVLLETITDYSPCHLYSMIYLGGNYSWGETYAKGNVTSSGLYGDKQTIGAMIGGIPKYLYTRWPDGKKTEERRVGFIGFIGFKIISGYKSYQLIGYSKYVHIKEYDE